jgi:hypothetical protein
MFTKLSFADKNIGLKKLIAMSDRQYISATTKLQSKKRLRRAAAESAAKKTNALIIKGRGKPARGRAKVIRE